MRHVAIFGDNLETFDRFGVADYIVEEDWAILLHPENISNVNSSEKRRTTMAAHSRVWLH